MQVGESLNSSRADTRQSGNLQALKLVFDRIDLSPLKRDQLKKKYEKYYRKGMFGNPPDKVWRHRLSHARMMLGNYSDYDGWQFRGDYASNLIFYNYLNCPMWNGGLIDRLLLIAEQGVGDEVLFASVLPDALSRAREVIFECDSRLVSIFQRSFPRLKCIPRKVESIDDSLPRWNEYKADAFLLLADLPMLFRRDIGHFPGKPYLKALPGTPIDRIGISWRGRQGEYGVNDFQIESPLSLQYDLRWDEDIEVPNIDLRNDLEGVFTLCSTLKRIVTVSTSVAHMAASIGCPVDVVLAPKHTGIDNRLNWRWGLGSKTPWYKSVTVYQDLNEYLRMRRGKG
jgi:hypothetical protein